MQKQPQFSWNDAARRMFGFDDSVVIGFKPPWIPADQGSAYESRFRASVIDALGMADETTDDSSRQDIGHSIIEHLVASARNKGCAHVEVTDPLAAGLDTEFGV